MSTEKNKKSSDPIASIHLTRLALPPGVLAGTVVFFLMIRKPKRSHAAHLTFQSMRIQLRSMMLYLQQLDWA